MAADTLVECSCGIRYDLRAWYELPLAGFTFQFDRDRELRMCPCGRMLVGVEKDSRRPKPVRGRTRKKSHG